MTNWAVFDRTMVVYWSCLIGGEIATGRTRSVIDGTANPLWLHFLPNYGIYCQGEVRSGFVHVMNHRAAPSRFFGM